MLRILLLDCSAVLESKLKSQGFKVETGTVGFCTGVRKLPSQMYEQDVFFYNPEPIPKNEFITTDAIQNLTPQYDLRYVEARIRNGGTFVAFVNPVSTAIARQRIFYSWIPDMPEIEFTSDTVILGNRFNSYPDTYARILAPVVTPENLSLPILLKLKPPKAQDYPCDVFNLFWNAHGDCIGVQILRGHGSLIFLPKYKSNDEMVETFLHRVVPQIYKSTVKTRLTDVFSSPAEKAAYARLEKLQHIEQKLKENQGDARVQLATATREKVNALEADPTAKQILTCYDLAKRQDDAALFYLYKIVEAVENKFGGEAEGIKAVGAKAEWKAIKKLANESYRDARHAPKPGEVIRKWTHAEINKCFEETEVVVSAYFATLFPPDVETEHAEAKRDGASASPAN